jgi:hypothetical protein
VCLVAWSRVLKKPNASNGSAVYDLPLLCPVIEVSSY